MVRVVLAAICLHILPCITAFRAVPALSRGHARSRIAPQMVGKSITPSSSEYSDLAQTSVISAATGKSLALTGAWDSSRGKRAIVAFFTHWGDFNSFEFGQKLLHVMPTLSAAGVAVVAVGIGTLEGARLYSQLTGFPLEMLYVDTSGESYKRLGYYEGFGRGLPVNPYLKLLPMLMGIGSPGTIQAVLRGYIGDRQADAEWTGDYLNLVDKSAFDVLGKEGARPFEVATVRLQNMMQIIPNWETLAPPNKDLITQQGGALVFEGPKVLKSYKDKGILVYTDIDDLVATALAGKR